MEQEGDRMCERVTIIDTLEKMNSNLERIATALERAYPPAISIAQEEMVEFKCDKCGLERSTHLPWYAPWEADE